MNKPSSSKTPIVILVIILLIGAGFYFYTNATPSDTNSLTSDDSSTSEAALAGSKVLTLLNQITSLKIDTSLFKSPVYTSLMDHTVPIYEQPVGKPNPFLYTLPPRAKK
jgi:hypothetical protein